MIHFINSLQMKNQKEYDHFSTLDSIIASAKKSKSKNFHF